MLTPPLDHRMLVLSKETMGTERVSTVDEQAIVIFGRVTRGDGSPLPGAAVTLCDLAGDQLDRAGTDAGGHYRLTPPAGGTYLLICSSAQRRPRASLIAVSDTSQRHDVGLDGGGATLEGGVGSGPDALADAVLTLTDVSGVVVAVTRTAADGSYTFADLPEGVYTLTAAGSGVTPIAETVQVPAEGRVRHDLTPSRGATLSGTVRSATGSRPVAEALAALVSADGSVVGSAVTGEDGTFRFPDVRDGVYTITASGYAPVASEVSVGHGGTTDVDLVLTPPMTGPEPGADPGNDTDARSDAGDPRDDEPTRALPSFLKPAPGTDGTGGTDGTDAEHTANGHVPAHAATDGSTAPGRDATRGDHERTDRP